MMAPLPTQNPPGDRPELPRVRLEVRTGAGRTIGYEFSGNEFLIGGAGACNLRLTANGAPPVGVQLTRKPDGVRARRVTAGLPVVLNGNSLPAGTLTQVRDGDVLEFAGLTLTVHIPPAIPAPTARVQPAPTPQVVPLAPSVAPPQAPVPPRPEVPVPKPVHIIPRFISLEEEVPTAELVPDLPPEPVTAATPSDEHRHLAERKRALDAEDADRRAAWATEDAELIRRRRTLDTLAEELEADRVRWNERSRALDQELADRRAFEASANSTELGRARAEIIALRQKWLDECQRQRAEIVRQSEELQSERAAWESAQQESRDEQARTAAQVQELARQRELFAADRDIFEKARDTFEAGRLAESARLSAWETDLTARDGEVARREGLLDAARAAFDSDRARFQDEFALFERRTSDIESAERELAARTHEVDVRLEQLKRDTGEWEETVRLVTAEQERLRAEAERLGRQKTELDEQFALLADRAGQIESQQAVVAVFRAKLDRSRQDMEREAWQLAAARVREDEAQSELRKRVQEAEEVRAALSAVQADAAQERQRLEERDSLLAAGLEEIRRQRDLLAAEAARLNEREAQLDVRAAEFAEQAGMLKGRMTQAFDLQNRLEADRIAIREREAALTLSEEARQTLQEQLRRRSEDLGKRSKALDEMARQLATDRTTLGEGRAEVEALRQQVEDDLGARSADLEARAATVARQSADYTDKEQALARQVGRLKDVGAAVAAERKSLSQAREAYETERVELAAFRQQVSAELDALRAQAPELDDQAKLALDRVGAAREMLRGHLNELNDFARTSRADLETARAQIRQDAERLREQHEALDRAKDEHRLAVAGFRQQLVEWQGTVADMRRLLSTSETRIDAKQAATADATRQLAEETDRLRREREELTARRTEMERHLADMREWYRKKLRELALTNASTSTGEDEPTLPRLHTPGSDAPLPTQANQDDLEPGDRQLGELLRSLALVDNETLTALWAEANRQRRTLRQVLLASGAISLYQLALIEAGNLDALVLGRFRVIDRLRVTPREAIYRVHDPKRVGEKSGGFYLLRHLSEAEMLDAVHPDEFRQRFSAARDAGHANLAGVVEVTEINGRPGVLQEWLTGLFSADWPAFAAHPGCWVRLATMAAGALDAAHRVGLVHGRLTSDAFVLTAEGVLKMTGFGEPAWLSGTVGGSPEVSFAADLRAFGQVAFGWSQLAGKKRVARSKAFPESLWAVIRRLEADAEPPMGDTVAAAQPYQSAAELLVDLQRIARDTPFSDDAWEKLLKHVADNAPDSPAGLRKAG